MYVYYITFWSHKSTLQACNIQNGAAIQTCLAYWAELFFARRKHAAYTKLNWVWECAWVCVSVSKCEWVYVSASECMWVCVRVRGFAPRSTIASRCESFSAVRKCSCQLTGLIVDTDVARRHNRQSVIGDWRTTPGMPLGSKRHKSNSIYKYELKITNKKKIKNRNSTHRTS